MEKLVIFGLMSAFFVGCGDSSQREKAKVSPAIVAGAVTDCVGNNCVTYTGLPRVGVNVDMPSSYTMLDTPDANLCVDAFIRRGIVLPENTVARTLDATSWKSEGIAISDLETSAVPILNVVHLNQQCSNVMFQFYNRNGLYCIVKNTSSFSNVRIQRSCSAEMAEIEPIHHDSQGSSLNLFGWPFGPWRDPNATTGTYNSRLIELPCIP